VHLFVSAPPRLAPAQIVETLKSISAKEVFKKFPKVREGLWGGELWSDGYFVRAVGERLLDGGSPYAAVFGALVDLHGEAPLVAGRSKGGVERSLDDEWQDAPVEFGPNAADHGGRQSRGQFIRFVPKHANH